MVGRVTDQHVATFILEVTAHGPFTTRCRTEFLGVSSSAFPPVETHRKLSLTVGDFKLERSGGADPAEAGLSV